VPLSPTERTQQVAENAEQMTTVLVMPPEFPYADLCLVATLLEQSELFVPGYGAPEVGLYHPESFLINHRVHGVEFVILPDRNLASRIARVGMGEPVDTDRRAAAALMAFAQCLDLNFEPSIAFHELAQREGNRVACEELGAFRTADGARPQDWVDVALARTERLQPTSSTVAVEDADLARPLKRWRRNYILALKIAELELDGGTAIEKMQRLMAWMFSDFFLGGPALMFASLYFAPLAPRRRMLKHLRSPHRERAIAGAKNAAWDITHMSEFARLVHEKGTDRKRFLFATSDKALSRTAPLLFDFSDTSDESAAIAARLGHWWSTTDAQIIAEGYCDYRERLDDPSRQVNRDAPADYVSSLTAAGEGILCRWRQVPERRIGD